MQKLLTIQTLIILVLACYVLMLRQCRTNHVCPKCPQVTVDTIYLPGDPVPKEVSVKHKPTPKTIRSMPPPSGQDSNEMIQKYAEKVFYADTVFANDSSWLAIIHDSLQYNRINYRTFYFQKLRNQIIKESYQQKPRRKVFLGLQLMYNSTSSSTISPSVGILYNDKKEHIFGYSYNPFTQGHCFGVWYKLNRKGEN